MHFGRKTPLLMARVFIVEDGKVLTFFRRRLDRNTQKMIEYYSFPGGEVEKDETIEQAAVRETKEEMGIDIDLGPKIAIQVLDGFTNHAYSATITNGTPHLMSDSEEVYYSNQYNNYEVRWVPVSELKPGNLLYYSNFLPLIQGLSRGEVPAEPVHLGDE